MDQLQDPGRSADRRRQGESHRAGRQNARWQARSVRDLGHRRGYFGNLARDLKPGELLMHPWAEARVPENQSQPAQKRSDGRLPAPRRSPSQHGRQPRHAASLQDRADPRVGRSSLRDLDEPDVPPGVPRWPSVPTDPQPTWLGYSIGRWEGDTLVVETTGFNGLAWVDTVAGPSADRCRTRDRALHAARHRTPWTSTSRSTIRRRT